MCDVNFVSIKTERKLENYLRKKIELKQRLKKRILNFKKKTSS